MRLHGQDLVDSLPAVPHSNLDPVRRLDDCLHAVTSGEFGVLIAVADLVPRAFICLGLSASRRATHLVEEAGKGRVVDGPAS